MEELKAVYELARAFLAGVGLITVIIIMIDIFRGKR